MWKALETVVVLALAANVALIVAANIRRLRVAKDGRWHPHGKQMRRWVNGKWETRPMTHQEESEDWIESQI